MLVINDDDFDRANIFSRKPGTLQVYTPNTSINFSVYFKANLKNLENFSSGTLERELKMLTFMSLGNNHENIMICFFP